MERFWTKNIRRMLGLIVCAALIIRVIFQNDAPVNAEGEAAGRDTQDNRFYINGITVTADYGSELLEGHRLSDGEREYVIDADGRIRFDAGFMTVSGGDAASVSGNVSGGDAGSVSGNVSGGDAPGTDPNYFYIKSDKQQLELAYVRTDDFFEPDTPIVIQPNAPEGVYSVVLNRKFQLEEPRVYLRGQSGALTELESGAYTYSYVDSSGISVSAPVKAGEYEAVVTWMGVSAKGISYDCTGSDVPAAEYRDYIIYGQDGDFYITTAEAGQKQEVGSLFPGKSYAVQSIVIVGRNNQDNDNPFNYYRIERSDGTVLAEGAVENQDVVISNIAKESGQFTVYMYIRSGAEEHKAANAVSFITDNAAPFLTAVQWIPDSDGDMDSAGNIDSRLITAKGSIQLLFTVIEENAMEKVLLHFAKDGESCEPVTAHMAADSGTGQYDERAYRYTCELPGEGDYSGLALEMVDILGNSKTEIFSWNAIIDHVAPEIVEESIRLAAGDESVSIEKDHIVMREAVTISIPVREKNGLDRENIQLSCQTDGVKTDIIEYSIDEDADGIPGRYILSVPLAVNRTYTHFELTITDKAGNSVEYKPEWELILDRTMPGLDNAVKCIVDDKTEEFVELEPENNVELAAKQSVRLQFKVKDRNELVNAVLCFEQDGEKAEVSASLYEDNGADAYDSREMIWEFILSREAVYQDFDLMLEDTAGNIVEKSFSWKVIIDDTPPQIGELSWAPEGGTDKTIISGNTLLVDKAGVTLTVSVEETNIARVELGYLDDTGKTDVVSTITQSDGKPQKDFTFSIDSPDNNYRKIVIIITDKSGNVHTYGYKDDNILRVIIDGEGPGLQNLRQIYPQGDDWYRSQTRPIRYSFELKDYSRIASIQMIARPDHGGQIVWDLTDDYRDAAERNEEGYFIYPVTTDIGRFASAADQDMRYYFVITDEMGNRTDTSDGQAQLTAQMRVDNTAPSDKAYVRFAGDRDVFYDSLDEFVDIGGKQYQYGGQSGMLFNKSKVELTIYVTDQAADRAVDQAASGIRQVRVTYRYTDTNINGTKDQTQVLVYEDGSRDRAISRKVNITAGGKKMIMDAISFELTVSNSQQITAIDSIEITDNAGNVTVIREYTSANGLSVDYILDDRAPELSHMIPAGSSGYTGDGNTYYYNNNALDLSVVINENNFYPAEVSSRLRVGEAGKTISMSDFEDTGNYRYRSRFTMNDGDGIYRFSLSYVDRSGNAMIFRGDGGETYMTDAGTYTSPLLVLDTTAPIVNIRYYKDGSDITDSVIGGRCINGDVSAVISITETNFDPDLVQIVFSAADATDNHALNIGYNPEGWSRSGNTYSYTIPCTVEGHYSLTASCVDKAGNHSNSVPASDFVVDRTAPMVAVTYDITTENGYYNTDRVATVTVTEQNFDEEAADYVITSTGALPGITGWSHTAGNGCGGLHHVKTCRWSGQAVFGGDADYTFTFGCVDRAGNISVPVEEQAFTIDQTLPVIQVSYDNNDSLNERFFRESRTATVTVVEHNFVGSEVNLAVGSPDGEIHTPSAWRDAGADTYVCQISYDTDGDYSFDISYVDPAGNEAEAYAGDRFVIDLTAPELEISGVNDRSANNGVVAPVITYSDKNYDAGEVAVRIIGVNHGQITPEQAVTTNDDGQTITFMDFSHVQELDDLYTLEAAVMDKAGNSTTDSIVFSVNRFGSTYLFSRETQEMLDRYYTNQGPQLTITEINVDTLEHREISYSCDGSTVVLEQGADYTVQESGSEYEWKQYTYEIPGSNFDAEGVYVVTLQSVDRASNDVTNRIKEKNIEFTVDKTPPSIVLGGIENGGSYAETVRNLTIDAVDNIYLKNVDIYLNSQRVISFDEDTLSEYHGVVNYEIRETGSAQTVYVAARDAAGNETQTDVITFLISSNAFIRWFYNRPLFFGSIGAAAAITGAVILVALSRRKRKDEGKV